MPRWAKSAAMVEEFVAHDIAVKVRNVEAAGNPVGQRVRRSSQCAHREAF
ncbi:hypothetical protein [Streptomyces dangxiongensis]|nr:hypothetical protein [Streptomyces dangxiongensis]